VPGGANKKGPLSSEHSRLDLPERRRKRGVLYFREGREIFAEVIERIVFDGDKRKKKRRAVE